MWVEMWGATASDTESKGRARLTVLTVAESGSATTNPNPHGTPKCEGCAIGAAEENVMTENAAWIGKHLAAK
jgi:hypothetical protein